MLNILQQLRWEKHLKKNRYTYMHVAVQSLSEIHLFATPWTAALHASLAFTIYTMGLAKFLTVIIRLRKG